jgi:hypothetical protein
MAAGRPKRIARIIRMEKGCMAPFKSLLLGKGPDHWWLNRQSAVYVPRRVVGGSSAEHRELSEQALQDCGDEFLGENQGGRRAMTRRTLTLRPLFISRISLFAFVLLFLIVLFFEVQAGPGPSGQVGEHPFGSAFDITLFVLFICTLLLAAWRNWRLGVRVSATDLTVFGVFRDRTVPRSAVRDVTMESQLVWERTDGKIRTTPITAFLNLGGVLGFVARHNERSLTHLRREIRPRDW